ncbi:MAG: hypothetical protein PHH54_00470 [Candidatus Nanoarchaeia archaeon]|nr:hypothetical protein [Candidatus Nanoarchaeia archaeon]MDD5740437.1 hypothetical protein [Candidatus Nanoarchaeia archaeon]
MVNQQVLVRDKYGTTKKVIKVLLVIFVVLLVLLIAFATGFLISKPKVEIHLDNPIAGVVLKNTNELGYTNKAAVVEEGVIEFNEEYINYILIALGTGYLHKSPFFENPLIEFNLGGEVWSSEIKEGNPNSKKVAIENEDLSVSISKEEAVEALLSENIEQFMKDSVANGNTKIEMVAGKTELFTKGYLEMYKYLTEEKVYV